MTPKKAPTFPAPTPSREPQDSIAKVIAGWRETRPELEVDPIAITARLTRLNAVIGPQLEEVFARFGLRGADFALIATLVRLGQDSASQSRLGSELGLSAGTVSVRIDRLVHRALVERSPDPHDGRGAVISLTNQGHELFEACAPEHLINANALLAGLDETERDQLGRLLGKLLYTLEDDAEDDHLAHELGLIVAGAPSAVEERRAVGLPPEPGLLVRHIHPGGPAARSGIRPGDLITTAHRQPLRSRHDLEVALNQSRASKRALVLHVTRGAKAMRLRLTR
jgi:DNA-binding MarR family transcriptional regulator